jgi:tetratricopeptide (TPR) repeat protein
MLHSPVFWIVVGLVFLGMLWLRWIRWRNAADAHIERVGTEAFQMALAGQGWQAEQMIERLVAEIAEKHGPVSRLSGQALAAQSMVMLALNDYPRAAAALKKAAKIEPIDHTCQKERLTHQMNLGEMLSRMGNHAEAEEVLRQSLVERGDFYGKEHSGYAYGLESLGEVVLRQGRCEEALAMAEEAVTIDRANRNPHLAQDIALKAVALASRPAAGENCLPDWETLSAQDQAGVVQYCHVLAESFDAAVMVRVYQQLEKCLASSASAGPDEVLNVAIAITNMARKAGDHESRIAAFRRVLALMGDGPGKADALLGLALAQADAKQMAEADDSYRQAVALSEQSGNAQLAAQALRNYGVFLADEQRIEEAKALHERSVAAARQTGDAEILGRALCAAGIFYHHAQRYGEAMPLLEESAQLLPEEHPDAICVQSHLTTARVNQPCDCDQHTPQVIAEVIRKLLLERAPKGLVKDVRIDFADEQSPISVEATRKPTDEEGRQLYNAVQNAVSELRRRQAQVGYRA